MLPMPEGLPWRVVISKGTAPPAAAPWNFLDAAQPPRIHLHLRQAGFPRDLLHAAGEAYLELGLCAGDRQAAAQLPRYLRRGLPLALEGLAAEFWQGRGGLDERRHVMAERIASGQVHLGTPVDRLQELAAAVRAGIALSLEQAVALDEASASGERAADGYAWAVVLFLLTHDQQSLQLLVELALAAAHGHGETSQQHQALGELETAWQAFLQGVVLAGGRTAPPLEPPPATE